MKQRPTSPHLSIYKPMITSMSSIVGRFCGVYLYFITSVLVITFAYYIKKSSSVSLFLDVLLNFYQYGFVNKFIIIALTAFSLFAFFFYLLAVVRHLVWDFGYGWSLSVSKIMGYGMFLISIISSILLTFYMFFI